MKQIAILLTTFCLLPAQVRAQDGVIIPPDFRKVRWGMTMDQVKAAESAKPKTEKENVLGYEVSLPGFSDVVLVYVFAGNRLVRANYGVIVEHTNDNDYIEDYRTLVGDLTQKYGKPQSDDSTWKGDTFKDDSDHWGLAVATGELVYQAVWVPNATQILLTLSGDNYNCRLSVQYTSKELGHLEDEQKKTSDF
jgi:hypothetical protein